MITDGLYEYSERRPDSPFLIFEDKTFTYRDFAALVSAFAGRLADIGVEPGQHVALVCGNRPAYLVAWFALTELGAVTVPLNVALMASGLRYTLEQSDARLLLIDENIADDKLPYIQDMAIPTVIIGKDVEAGPVAGAPRRAAYSPDPLALNAILYTSGTTGLPKGAMIPQGSYLAAGKDMAASLALTAEDRILVVLPLFHANPQMYAIMSVLEVGACLVLAPRFSASEFFPLARRHGATGFTYVGTVLNILEKAVPGDQVDHSLRWCVGGGAPAAVWTTVSQRFGLEVFELYGMTETGGWVTMNTSAGSRVGSVGRPRRAVRVAVLDEEGQALGPDQKGEIVASTDEPALFFLGYYNNPTATAATLRDRSLFTGDRGRIDADGFLHFEGRLKDLIRRGGEMISPTEIELQIMKHPQVRDCGVVGVEDELLGEEIKAVVVPGEQFDPGDLVSFLKDRIPQYMVPRYIAQTEAIPKTETEKVKRHALVDLDAPMMDVSQLIRATVAEARR